MMIPGKFSIMLVGDLMLGRSINEIILNRHIYPYGNTLDDLIKDADFFIGNLETSITTESNKWPKKFNFRFFPKHIKALTLLTPQFSNMLSLTSSFVSTNLSHVSNSRPLHVSLANNHVLDYGYTGYRETVKTLNDNQINYTGVGDFKQIAMTPCVVNIASKDGTALQIACFSASDHPQEWHSCNKNSAKCHTPIPNVRSENEHAGIYCINTTSSQDLSEFQNQIQKYRKYVDLIIVSLHWGPNYCWKPNRSSIKFAKSLIDAGVDVIHGHSSHHVQGIEIYKGKPIIYGCGDFVNDYSLNSEYRNDLGFIYTLHLLITPISARSSPPLETSPFQSSSSKQQATLKEKSIKFVKIDLQPTKISSLQVNLMDKKEEGLDYEWLIDRMKTLCNDFGTKCEEKDEGGLVINL